MSDYVNPRAHACQNCVKAKAKCYGQTDGRCERCKRLDRQCIMQYRNSPRQGAPAKSKRSNDNRRIAQLEHKLNSLVSLLGTSNAQVSDEDLAALELDTPGNASSGSTSASTHTDSRYTPIMTAAEPSSTTLRPDSTMGPTSFMPAGGRNVKSPSELLGIFRRDMAHQVPFISVPSQISPVALSREHPFLYRAILTAASYHDSLHQLEMGQELVKSLTEHIIILGKKNMDILQGLLVYINWYNNLFHHTPQTNTLLALAFSLLVDLNLYMPFKCSEKHEKFVGEMKIAITCNPNWTRTSEPSREERRAVLGCFYLFSCVSSKFRNLNPLQWTANIQQSYENILKTPESENDVRLVHLVDLQRIAENTKYIIMHEMRPLTTNTNNNSIGLHLKSLMSDLQRFKATLPEKLQQDVMMTMHYHTVEILVFDLCFLMPPSSSALTLPIQKRDALLMCLAATRALVDAYLSQGIEPHISFSSVSVAQIWLAMITISKLILFKSDELDLDYVRQSVNLSTFVDEFATRLEERSSRYDLMESRKPWLETSRKMRQVMIQFDNMMEAESAAQATEQPLNASLPAFHLDHFDFDDRFWPSILNDAATFN